MLRPGAAATGRSLAARRVATATPARRTPLRGSARIRAWRTGPVDGKRTAIAPWPESTPTTGRGGRGVPVRGPAPWLVHPAPGCGMMAAIPSAATVPSPAANRWRRTRAGAGGGAVRIDAPDASTRPACAHRSTGASRAAPGACAAIAARRPRAARAGRPARRPGPAPATGKREPARQPRRGPAGRAPHRQRVPAVHRARLAEPAPAARYRPARKRRAAAGSATTREPATPARTAIAPRAATTARSAPPPAAVAAAGTAATTRRPAMRPARRSRPGVPAGCRRREGGRACQFSPRLDCRVLTSVSSSASSASEISPRSAIQATKGDTDPFSVLSTKLETTPYTASFTSVVVS